MTNHFRGHSLSTGYEHGLFFLRFVVFLTNTNAHLLKLVGRWAFPIVSKGAKFSRLTRLDLTLSDNLSVEIKITNDHINRLSTVLAACPVLSELAFTLHAPIRLSQTNLGPTMKRLLECANLRLELFNTELPPIASFTGPNVVDLAIEIAESRFNKPVPYTILDGLAQTCPKLAHLKATFPRTATPTWANIVRLNLCYGHSRVASR